MTRYFIQVFATFALIFSLVPGAAAQEPDIVGHYAIDHDITQTGDQIVLTLTLLLKNQGELSAPAAVVAIANSDWTPDDGSEPGPDATVGTFESVDVAAGSSVRLRAQFVIPIDEWVRWNDRDGPRFWLTYVDQSSQRDTLPLTLARTGAIPEVNEF